MFETGRSLRTDDYRGECLRRSVAPVADNVALPHWVGVPMSAGERTHGVLLLRSPSSAIKRQLNITHKSCIQPIQRSFTPRRMR